MLKLFWFCCHADVCEWNTSMLWRSKLQLRWKLCGKMCEEEVQLSRPRPKSEIVQWHRKERWRYCLFYHWGCLGIEDAAVFGDLANRLLFLFFYQVSPASRTCLQAHRHWQMLWDLDPTWNQEEINKGFQPVTRMFGRRVIPLPAKWASQAVPHPKINKAESLPLMLQTPVDKTI